MSASFDATSTAMTTYLKLMKAALVPRALRITRPLKSDRDGMLAQKAHMPPTNVAIGGQCSRWQSL
jgi:hypothetical protein